MIRVPAMQNSTQTVLFLPNLSATKAHRKFPANIPNKKDEPKEEISFLVRFHSYYYTVIRIDINVNNIPSQNSTNPVVAKTFF